MQVQYFTVYAYLQLNGVRTAGHTGRGDRGSRQGSVTIREPQDSWEREVGNERLGTRGREREAGNERPAPVETQRVQYMTGKISKLQFRMHQTCFNTLSPHVHSVSAI